MAHPAAAAAGGPAAEAAVHAVLAAVAGCLGRHAARRGRLVLQPPPFHHLRPRGLATSAALSCTAAHRQRRGCRTGLVLGRRMCLVWAGGAGPGPRSLSSAAIDGAATYYEALGVQRNASTADIKAAFLTLSKMHHPDLNFSENEAEQQRCHDTAVRLNEAFAVLGDPATRRQYDLQLGFSHEPVMTMQDVMRRRHGRQPGEQAFWSEPDPHPHYGSSPYAMFSHSTVIAFLVAWILIGIAVHYLHYRTASKDVLEILNEHTRVAASDLSAARTRAATNGYRKQLEDLITKTGTEADLHTFRQLSAQLSAQRMPTKRLPADAAAVEP